MLSRLKQPFISACLQSSFVPKSQVNCLTIVVSNLRHWNPIFSSCFSDYRSLSTSSCSKTRELLGRFSSVLHTPPFFRQSTSTGHPVRFPTNIGDSPDPKKRKMTSITTVQKGSLNKLDYRIYYRNETGPISPFHDIPLRAATGTNIFNMVVEVPRWTNAKMEIATKEPLNPIKQDIKKGQLRYVANCFPHHGYIWNYGALPQTWENPNYTDESTNCKGDNDPIDVCEIGGRIQPRGAVVQVKILGCFALIDEGETDWKLLAVDVNDPMADKLNDINDIEKLMPGYLRATVEWFRIYKIPDGKPENQFAFNGEPKNAAFALNIIEETHKFWQELSQKRVNNDGELALERTTDANSPFNMSVADAEGIVNGNPEAGSPGPVDPFVDKWHYITVNPNGS
ncbi:Inorganic pyrophosphatase [Orchesella cincta]|uniref:Inorganic pyrophosphatase n=1 Tax=Orchesella cincta TaxID=48709 RepID=A0A1D2N694_ORCCI|nr:Inorganic pyrophosphatase [Orchesella cincta]